MPNVTMREMLEAGVHFGHQTTHWNPKMKPYVFGDRNGIYIIDLQKTVDYTKNACSFLKKVTSEGKRVLFVGTKKQAKDVVKSEAVRSEMLYVNNRWLGGMLTNYQTVKQSIDRMKKIIALKESEEWKGVPKKEQSRTDRELAKLEKSLGGISDMKKLPGAVFIVDTAKEHIAVKEARKLGIPTVAVVDTNSDPTLIDHVIPGNDDALRSVSLFVRLAADSCIEGASEFKRRARVKALAEAEKEEEVKEKTVSKFEGDIDLRGEDEADIAAQEEQEATADTETTPAAETKEEKK